MKTKRPRIKRQDPDYAAGKKAYETVTRTKSGEASLIPVAREMQAAMRRNKVENPFHMARLYLQALPRLREGHPDWFNALMIRAAAYYLTGDHIRFAFSV